MPALDAYHSKATAYADLHTALWHAQMDGFMSSMRGEHSGTQPSPGSVKVWGGDPDGVTTRLARQLTMAESYYVSPLMARLVSTAAEAWVPEEVVEAGDFVSDYGWLFIPGGITVVDIRGQTVTTSAVSWERVGGLVYVAMWADKANDPPALKAHPGWGQSLRMTPWHLSHIDLGRPLLRTLRMGTLLPPEISEQITYADAPDGHSTTLYFPKGWTAEELAPSVRPDEILAWLVSTLRIMQTTLAATTRTGLPANVRAARNRERWRVKQTAVTVIELRHRASEFAGRSEREYTHQWLRRGHWRKQWYGSERNDDRRQVRIWIHPALCGPEGAPLLLREHVNALIR